MELNFEFNDTGDRTISGRKFENCQFLDLEILPSIGNRVWVENCHFLNCSTSPGTCVIGSDVTLDNVVFSDLECGDAIQISSETELNEVVIKGKRPKALIIQPENEAGFVMPELKAVDYQLDISEFLGNVTIIGMRGNMVRKNSTRHVTVHARWRHEVDWKALGIGASSYWRIFVLKLSVFNATEGVFSLPNSADRHFEETMHEKQMLESIGIQFD